MVHTERTDSYSVQSIQVWGLFDELCLYFSCNILKEWNWTTWWFDIKIASIGNKQLRDFWVLLFRVLNCCWLFRVPCQALSLQKLPPELFYKKAVLKNFNIQYSKGNTCVGISFYFIKKRPQHRCYTLSDFTESLVNSFFYSMSDKNLWWQHRVFSQHFFEIVQK